MDGALLKLRPLRVGLLLCLVALLLPGAIACAASSGAPETPQVAQDAGSKPSDPTAEKGTFVPADGKAMEQPAQQGAPAQPQAGTMEPQAAQPAAAAPGGSAGQQPAMAPPAAMGTEPAAPAAMGGQAAMEKEPAPQGGMQQPPGTWEKEGLENLYYPDPTTLRVAILNASGKPGRAGMVAFFLEEYRRAELEKKIGKKITVVNLSNLAGARLRDSYIYYKQGHLRAALLMADAIPGKQVVTPMSELNDGKIGIDVEIRIGSQMP